MLLVRRLAETWVVRPATPTRAVIDVTRRCNLRCSMCRTWERAGSGALTADELGAVFDRLPRLCWLDLTGGEPLLRSDFSTIVEHALDRLPALSVLHFQTNGWLGDRALAVVDAARRRQPEVDLIVTVSIDGPEAIHDAIRGRPGSYQRAAATLASLQARADDDDGFQVHAGTTVTRANADTFESVGELLEDRVPGFSAERWHWNLGQRSEHFFGNGSAPGVEPATTPRQTAAAIARHLERRGLPRDMVSLMETIYLVNLRAVALGERAGIGCQALRSSMFLSPEGDLYPCHVWDRPLGNVRDTPIDTLWRSTSVLRARREVERLDCGGCFAACEAYPAIAGAPIATALLTVRRAASLARA